VRDLDFPYALMFGLDQSSWVDSSGVRHKETYNSVKQSLLAMPSGWPIKAESRSSNGRRPNRE